MTRYLLASLLCIVFLQPQLSDAGSNAPVPTSGDESKALTDGEIKKILIAESIETYDGNCPCPYSRMRNGARCGKRSAYSREGGEAPLCYPKDVTPEMVQAYRDAHSPS